MVDVLDARGSTNLLAVGSEEAGPSEEAERVEQRRLRHGMSVSGLAQRAGVDRGRLAKWLKGEVEVRPTFVAVLEQALDSFEEEVGDRPGSPNDDLVEFRVSGNFGVDVVVKGPLRDAEELEKSVARLIQRIQKQEPPRNG